MDNRVWAVESKGKQFPSVKFEGLTRLITVKNIDATEKKTAKVWMDSRFKEYWNQFDNIHVGDLVTNLHDIPGKPGRLNSNSMKLKKCVHKNKVEVIPDHDHETQSVQQPKAKSKDGVCATCKMLGTGLKKHLDEVHQVKLF